METDEKIAVMMTRRQGRAIRELLVYMAHFYEATQPMDAIAPNLDVAARVRGLAALFSVLLLCACAADAPPPYTIEYDDNVSVADRSLWADAIDRWNAVVGTKVLQWEPQDRKCGRVLIVMDDSIGSADTSRTACNKVVRYRPDYADQCVFEHELGHVLGLEDVVAVGLRNDIGARVIDVPEPPRDTIMRDCNGALQDITDADGAEVRALWGIP